ncbi:uncharacterized protein LOC119370950 [Jatropha curcas]|uniref:uncharacterized protein LOC119370950 n=1 Tax=Jatropha curcas TaxID=180498 RepID=UPI001893130D|nr:uncharacterized protein LOC119370950 [Jatropha curcas]
MAKKHSSKVFSEEEQQLLSYPTDDERVQEDNCLFSWFLSLFKKPRKSLDNFSFGNFPFDTEGNLLTLKEVKYIDRKFGRGDSVEMVNVHKLQVWDCVHIIPILFLNLL